MLLVLNIVVYPVTKVEMVPQPFLFVSLTEVQFDIVKSVDQRKNGALLLPSSIQFINIFLEVWLSLGIISQGGGKIIPGGV